MFVDFIYKYTLYILQVLQNSFLKITNIMSEDLFSKALSNPDEKIELEVDLDPADKIKTEKTSNEKETTDSNDSKQEEVNANNNSSEKVVDEDNKDVGKDLEEIEKDVASTESTEQKSTDQSDDDSSSSSSDEEDGSDKEAVNDEDELDEDNEDESVSTDPIRSKNEIVEEQVPELPEDYTIDEETQISLLGKIQSVFNGNIIAHANSSAEYKVLKDGAIFCLQDKTLIGTLVEVFGPIELPFYRVALSKKEAENVDEWKAKIGENVYTVLNEVDWLNTTELKKIKGSDASNPYDEEIPIEEQEFSDDEEERRFMKMKKNKKKNKRNDHGEKGNNDSIRRKQNPTISYDDDNDNIKEMVMPKGMFNGSTSNSTVTSYRSRNNREEDSNSEEIVNDRKRQRNSSHSQKPFKHNNNMMMNRNPMDNGYGDYPPPPHQNMRMYPGNGPMPLPNMNQPPPFSMPMPPQYGMPIQYNNNGPPFPGAYNMPPPPHGNFPMNNGYPQPMYMNGQMHPLPQVHGNGYMQGPPPPMNGGYIQGQSGYGYPPQPMHPFIPQGNYEANRHDNNNQGNLENVQQLHQILMQQQQQHNKKSGE